MLLVWVWKHNWQTFLTSQESSLLLLLSGLTNDSRKYILIKGIYCNFLIRNKATEIYPMTRGTGQSRAFIRCLSNVDKSVRICEDLFIKSAINMNLLNILLYQKTGLWEKKNKKKTSRAASLLVRVKINNQSLCYMHRCKPVLQVSGAWDRERRENLHSGRDFQILSLFLSYFHC